MIFISDKPMPYVYIGIHKITGQFYIGSRTRSTINKPSYEDLMRYKTSSKIVKPIFHEFVWNIVAEFFSPKDALDFEQQLIFESWNNPLILNQACHINHESHWSTAGRVVSESTRQKLSQLASKRIWSDAHKQRISDSQKGKTKPCKREEKFFWYNDGTNNKLFSETEPIPPKFTKGRLMTNNQNNSFNKGKSWHVVDGKRIYTK
jgi:hypothetical protein